MGKVRELWRGERKKHLFGRMGKRTSRLLDNCSVEQPKDIKDGCEGSRGH